MSDTRPILAVRTRNCVKFIRITYYFDFVIGRDFVTNFPTYKCEINEFSKFVKDANDHFKLASFEPPILISGVFNEKTIEVSFGKFSSTEIAGAIVDFEQQMIAFGFGTHIHLFEQKSA